MNKIINIVSAKQSVFYFFLAILFLPLFQFYLPFTKEAKLNGVEPAQALPEFSIATWITGDYQKSYEPEFEKNIGFHNSLVRLHNQIYYSVFNQSIAPDVVIGKNDYLYFRNYIEAYTGEDFLGTEFIEIQAAKIKQVQAALKKKNIAFFVVLAPGKASFYPEYIPDNFKKIGASTQTNYSFYKKTFSSLEVNVLDLQAYFISIKDTSKYPLFVNSGVHWTEYGSYIAGREITKYVETLTKTDLTDIHLQSIKMEGLSGADNTDYDAANMMNLFTTIPHPKVASPKLRFVSTKAKPKLLCISDSYFTCIINTRIPASVFHYHDWLYNNGILPESFLKEKKVSSINMKKEIENQDVVCLLSTDATLPLFPYGFIDRAYEMFVEKDSDYYTLKNREFRNFIKITVSNMQKNKSWRASMAANAKRKNIAEMDEFLGNAVWLYNETQVPFKND